MPTRRSFVATTFKASAMLALAPTVPCFAMDGPVHVLRARTATPEDLSANFLGLGYEMSSVAHIGLLNPHNDRYVRLVRGLGPQGVLRVGGIVADYTRYEPSGSVMAEPKNTVITQQCLKQFSEFLNTIGWTAIWSLNFAQGTLSDAIQEAHSVADALGPHLQAFELGNEVENYDRGEKPFRQPPYTFETYHAEYSEWQEAILKVVPGARFAAPDTAASVEWVERMAAGARGQVQLLTTHYYRGGQRLGTPEQLLRPDPKLKEILTRLRTASKHSGIPWRMCETNSFFGGGRPGLSDTFLGALWTLDYLLLLAEYGCAGVNLETGVNQLGFVSSYSPVQGNESGNNRAGVPYYGMLAFAAARQGCTQSISIEVSPALQDVTAYALGTQGIAHSLVILNRGQHAVRVSTDALGFLRPTAMRLTAPAQNSSVGVTFAGTAVDESGRWAAGVREQVDGANISIPAMSAVVLHS